MSSNPDSLWSAEAQASGVLDGERALTWTAACVSESLSVIKLAALRGTRAYMVLFASPTSSSPGSDQAAFDPIVSSFRFAAP